MELSVQPCVVCCTATYIDAKQRSCAKTYLHSIRVLYTSHMRELCRLFDIVCKARKANRASGVGSERTHIVVKTDWCYSSCACGKQYKPVLPYVDRRCSNALEALSSSPICRVVSSADMTWCDFDKVITRRGTRARNPQIRSLIRYPLRQPRSDAKNSDTKIQHNIQTHTHTYIHTYIHTYTNHTHCLQQTNQQGQNTLRTHACQTRFSPPPLASSVSF